MNLAPFVIFIADLIDLYGFIVIAWLIVSWLVHFEILNMRTNFVYKLWYFLEKATEPAIKPIQRVIPPLGGLDISPIILFMILKLVKNILFQYLM